MRKLIFAINLTLDGCVDHTKLSGDDELYEHYAQLIRYADLLVYGRKTYQLMVPFWPDVAKNQSGQTKAMNDFATERSLETCLDALNLSMQLANIRGKLAESYEYYARMLEQEITKLRKSQPAS